MESKRKANGRVSVDTEDRGSKRRKITEYDLLKGESKESTTAYGLAFLEQIRRTADKSGRLVATYFEKLLPREGNADYYKRTRMPISLETIEEKLNNHEFKTLAELESYFKRMIANAKEFYPRSSTTFDDAERVRKALSNYMTKTNPAYNNRGYQAVPTPFPDEDAEDADEEDDAEVAGEDADEEENAEDEEDTAADEKEEEEAEAEEEEEEEEEKPDRRGSRRRSIILKRRGPPRASRHSISQAQESPVPPSRPDHQYEGVPYKGLTFQQAQEKLVEELLRHQEPEYEDSYFEAFINLPPRALKDYYKVISEPLSIKKLQKMVKGTHGRNGVTGVSPFKTWSAFEEKISLLWTNAYFYNEEGSEIYSLAQELEAFIKKQLKAAQAAAPEPAQPKIKLKVGQAAEAAPTPSKKITIHLSGRGDSVDSPAPQTSQSAGTPVSAQPNGTTRTATPMQSSLGPADKARSVSASAPSPSPSVQGGLKPEDSAASLANIAVPPTAGSEQTTTPAAAKPPAPQPQPYQHNPLANGYMEQKHPRAPGKGIDDALISKIRILNHPTVQSPNPLLATVFPHPTEMHQSATVNLSANQCRILIVTTVPESLRNRQYSLWTLLDRQPLKPPHQPMVGQQMQERTFEVILHPGINVFESHLIAAVPRGERVPNGPEVELEVFTILINVMRS